MHAAGLLAFTTVHACSAKVHSPSSKPSRKKARTMQHAENPGFSCLRAKLYKAGIFVVGVGTRTGNVRNQLVVHFGVGGHSPAVLLADKCTTSSRSAFRW